MHSDHGVLNCIIFGMLSVQEACGPLFWGYLAGLSDSKITGR